MSGEIEDSDSWESIIMDGIMNRMAKMTGLRVVHGHHVVQGREECLGYII